jgi:hypothetical protein
VTPDRQDVVQTAEVPQTFIKFLRTFQDMVNILFCDPTHGNLIAFEAFPAANGFGNDYKILKQQPMPTSFTGEQIPDLDEVLKVAIKKVKPMSAFTGNPVAPLTATGAAPVDFATPNCSKAPPPSAISTKSNPVGFKAPASVANNMSEAATAEAAAREALFKKLEESISTDYPTFGF